jgi:hypothetical protein
MPPDNNDRVRSLPLTVRMRIDEVCMRFEAAWQNSPAPPLEGYLGAAEGPERAALLRDLLRLDLELRFRHNGVPAVEEYLARFPGNEGVIREEMEHFAARLNAPQPEAHRDTGSAAATPTSTGNRPETEVSIPGYEVRRRLGIGGMGIVYEALQVKAARPVALKVIRSGEEADPEELKRFRDEAESAARLQHPNIAQIYEVGDHNGRPFFSMELCSAGSLDHYLRGGPLLPAEAAALVETLAHAMHHAHQEQVIHRDLKPANILLSPARATHATTGSADTSTEEGRPSLSSLLTKVGDFGLARKLDTGGQTQTGAILGTPSYMAPEQASGRNKELGPACDVYALGAILYECLTGRPPFKAATALDTVMQVISDDPVPPTQLNAKLPRDLETICLKCLQKEPGKRFGSALALAEDLRRFQAGEAIAARPVGRPERAWRWCRRNPVTASMLGAIVFLLLTVVGVSTVLGQRAVAKAEEASQEAYRAGIAEEGQRKKAEEETKQRKRAEQLLYASRLSLVLSFWAEGGVYSEMLDETQEYRDTWEHRYLYTMVNHRGQRTFMGHSDEVTSVSFSPDGRRIATGSRDQMGKIWDAASGKEVLSLKGHWSEVTSVSFSPDGRRIASGSLDRTVKIWDVASGQELLSLEGHTGGVSSVAFSPDGQYLASGSGNRFPYSRNSEPGQVKVWDAGSGEGLRTLNGHARGITSVAFSPDGRLIASGSEDKTVKVWDAASGEEPMAGASLQGALTKR